MPLQVECAISRATKEKRVAELTEALEMSDVAFAVRYNKISVKNFEAFRRALPADAKLYVAKNTLMKQAVSRVSHRSSLLAHHDWHARMASWCLLTLQDAAPRTAVPQRQARHHLCLWRVRRRPGAL